MSKRDVWQVEPPSERIESGVGDSAVADAVDTVRGLVVWAWVRAVGGLLWGVTGYQAGVALDAAGVPVARMAGDLVAGLPVDVAPGTAGALVLAGGAAPLGVLWTLRWSGESLPHRRRLLALGLLVTLPFALSAVEMVVVGAATAVAPDAVTAPSGPIRTFYHVAATLAIAFGAALGWGWMERQNRKHRRF